MEERDPSKRSTSPAWKRQVIDTYRHTNRQHNMYRIWPSSFLLLNTNRVGSGAVETIRHSDALKQQRLGLRLCPGRSLYTDLDNPTRPLGALRELTHRGSHTITRRLTGKTTQTTKLTTPTGSSWLHSVAHAHRRKRPSSELQPPRAPFSPQKRCRCETGSEYETPTAGRDEQPVSVDAHKRTD